MPKAALRKAAKRAKAVAMTAEQRRTEREAGDADDGEHEAHQLCELQRRYGFPFGDRAQPRRHQLGEDQPVGVLTRPAQRADREHDGLQPQQHGGGNRAESRDDQHRDQDGGGDPRREAGPTDVHLCGGGGGVGTGRHLSTPVAHRAGRRQAAYGRSRVAARKKGAATQQLQQQQQQPATRHRSTARRLVSDSSRRADTPDMLPNDRGLRPTEVRGPSAGQRPWEPLLCGTAAGPAHRR